MKEEAGCTIKVVSMDTVHGKSGVTKAEKPPSNQDGVLALRGLVVCPTVTSPLETSGRCLLITETAILFAPLLSAAC